MGSNFGHFLYRGVNFLAFLYRGSNFGHFCIGGQVLDIFVQGDPENAFFIQGGLENAFFVQRVSKMPFCCIGGLKNANLLYRGSRKCHFLYRGSRKLAKFLPPPHFKMEQPLAFWYIYVLQRHICSHFLVKMKIDHFMKLLKWCDIFSVFLVVFDFQPVIKEPIQIFLKKGLEICL